MNKQKKYDQLIIYLIISLLFLSGLSVIFYPSISNFINMQNQKAVIELYHQSVTGLPEEKIEKAFQDAFEYNSNIKVKSSIGLLENTEVKDTQYYSLLNVDGIMARVSIPKININIPVYHNTSEQVLQKGAGHLFGTSLPVGGKGTHSVLTAHSGQPHSKLFTNLDRLELDDRFYIYILNKTLVYEVDQIKIIEPSNFDELQIAQTEDYVTLLTCTPIGINSHRLLVRGKRIDLDTPDAQKDAEIETAIYVSRLNIVDIIIIALIILILIFTIIAVIRKKRCKS